MNRKDKDELNKLIHQIDNRRFCKNCNQYHGWLYICPQYSKNLKTRLEGRNRIWVEFLSDEEMVRRAIKMGIPEEKIMFWRIFAGIV
jgi:hypothetical protein